MRFLLSLDAGFFMIRGLWWYGIFQSCKENGRFSLDRTVEVIRSGNETKNLLASVVVFFFFFATLTLTS